MSLHAYCQKASDGEQKSHCNKKCLTCVIEITRVKAIWKERYELKPEDISEIEHNELNI